MTLPKDAEVIGVNAGKLPIKSTGSHTIVTLNAGVHPNRASNTSGNPAQDRFYLILENIQGTCDATILNVYINLPAVASLGDHRNLLAGSVSLYGLRRASIQSGERVDLGLTSILDITRRLNDPSALGTTPANEIRISIVPNRPLPDAADLVIERVRIFRQSHRS